MGDKTGIGWTESTWTTVTGCTRVSPGCGGPGPHGGCYAEILSARKLAHLEKYKGVAYVSDGGDGGRNARWTGLIRTHPDALDQPLRWRKPRRIFVNSMSDLFHKDVPDEFIAAVFGVMAACPQHTFQLLTKRAERLPVWFAWLGAQCPDDKTQSPSQITRHFSARAWYRSDSPWNWSPQPWPLPNVHVGVSVEDQPRADERLQYLFDERVKAAVRWVSAEPLLGPIDFGDMLSDHSPNGSRRECIHFVGCRGR